MVVMNKHILWSVEYLQHDLRAAYKKPCLHKKQQRILVMLLNQLIMWE